MIKQFSRMIKLGKREISINAQGHLFHNLKGCVIFNAFKGEDSIKIIWSK